MIHRDSRQTIHFTLKKYELDCRLKIFHAMSSVCNLASASHDEMLSAATEESMLPSLV